MRPRDDFVIDPFRSFGIVNCFHAVASDTFFYNVFDAVAEWNTTEYINDDQFILLQTNAWATACAGHLQRVGDRVATQASSRILGTLQAPQCPWGSGTPRGLKHVA